jgi:hypothetical protein
MGGVHLSPLWLSLISSAVLLAVAVWEALRPRD